MELRAKGFTGYRLHRQDVPGNPDIVFFGAKRAIFVNGCFWHGHTCRVGVRRPLSNRDYWLPKIAKTQERDKKNSAILIEQGWKVLTIWECEIKDRAALSERLNKFIKS